MSMIEIGNWVQREKRKSSKWHRVESVVDGDAFTRCGRRMAHKGLKVSEVEIRTRAIGQPQNCKGCE